MGPIGMPEMMAIFVLALLLFGPKKLPELGRMLGKGLSEFRRAKNELTNTFETHMRELEREAKMEEQGKKPQADYSPPAYPYPYDEAGQTSGQFDGPYSYAAPYAAPSEPAVPETIAPAEVSIPVPGTIARSNGHVAVDTVAAGKEEHPA